MLIMRRKPGPGGCRERVQFEPGSNLLHILLGIGFYTNPEGVPREHDCDKT